MKKMFQLAWAEVNLCFKKIVKIRRKKVHPMGVVINSSVTK